MSGENRNVDWFESWVKEWRFALAEDVSVRKPDEGFVAQTLLQARSLDEAIAYRADAMRRFDEQNETIRRIADALEKIANGN